MADRRVTQSRKDRNGDIAALCNPTTLWSPRPKADVIGDIELGAHTYFVDEAGHRTNIHVVNGPTGKYLRSTADGSSKNNLDNLLDC